MCCAIFFKIWYINMMTNRQSDKVKTYTSWRRSIRKWQFPQAQWSNLSFLSTCIKNWEFMKHWGLPKSSWLAYSLYFLIQNFWNNCLCISQKITDSKKLTSVKARTGISCGQQKRSMLETLFFTLLGYSVGRIQILILLYDASIHWHLILSN